MTENLTQMVKESPAEDESVSFPTEDLVLPESDVEETEEVIESSPAPESVAVVQLADWFEGNCSNFENINQVKVSIRGVDPNSTLIMAVIEPGAGQDDQGNDKRNIHIYNDADKRPVLNLPSASMDVYNNGFRVIYAYDETEGQEVFIKCYSVRTGFIAVFCVLVNEQLLPYATARLKKKDVELEVVRGEAQSIASRLPENADLETLQLLYKQSVKSIDEMTTNQDVVDWLLARQSEVTDINHHLQIDNVLIDMIG